MLTIGVVGVTGAVGREIVAELSECEIKDINLKAFASSRSEGQSVFFRNEKKCVESFSVDKIIGCDYLLLSAGDAFSREFVKPIAERGPIIIDSSSVWRLDKEVPLIVPEVNGNLLKELKVPRIIASPRGAAVQLAATVCPFFPHVEFLSVVALQSVSGEGHAATLELSSQMEDSQKYRELSLKVFEQPIAFNVLPALGGIDKHGHCDEEINLIEETKKILAPYSFEMLATTTVVPVFHCHCESIVLRLSHPVSREKAYDILGGGENVEFFSTDNLSQMPSPFHAARERNIKACRLRLLYGAEKSNWLQFWNVADNIKKGAATNIVQILEKLLDFKSLQHRS